MVAQTEMFPVLMCNAPARMTDPDTSHLASAEMKNSKATRMEEMVLDVLQRNPNGLTTHEMADRLGIQLVSVSPRTRPLVRKRLVEDSGERRMGGSGRASIVWRKRSWIAN